MTRKKRTKNRSSVRKNRSRAVLAHKRARYVAWLSGLWRVAATGMMAAVLGATAIFIHDVVTQCTYFSTDTIAVEGNQRLTREAVLQQADIGPGRNILGINLGQVRNRLLGHDWIAAADVSRELPNRLVIRIREHQPLAVLDTGRQFLVSRQRRIFTERRANEGADLPVIWGLTYRDISSVEIRPRSLLATALTVLETADDHLPDGRITRIRVDPHMGLTLETSGRFRHIFLGLGDVAHKLAYLQQVRQYRTAHDGMEPVDTLHLNQLPRIVMKPMPAASQEERSKEA